jgi:hypothetical protein
LTRANGHGDNGHLDVLQEPAPTRVLDNLPPPSAASTVSPELATRAKQRAKQQMQQNRFVIIGAGALVTALVIFVAISMPRRGVPVKTKSQRGLAVGQSKADSNDSGSDKSLFPIIDSGRSSATEAHDGFLNERDLQRPVTRSASKTPRTGQTNVAGTLGSIQPFGDQAWQAPPYRAGSAADVTDLDKAEREAMERSALIYASKTSPKPTTGSQSTNDAAPELGLGLATGTRLRARLDSAASTAVRTPVLAVIEYNYERDGEIVVPAGAKAVGHIREANRSGYVDIQFDSLLMPDGASVAIEAAATDLDLRPLKGRVEGKNTGKSVLVRSLSGIGQAGSMLLGQRSLNQPLNESDLIRERVSSNIGEAGDEEVSRLAMTQRIVVTVSAGVPIYVVLEQTPKSNQGSSQPARSIPPANSANVDPLRQLLQLQQELNQSTSNQSTQ